MKIYPTCEICKKNGWTACCACGRSKFIQSLREKNLAFGWYNGEFVVSEQTEAERLSTAGAYNKTI